MSQPRDQRPETRLSGWCALAPGARPQCDRCVARNRPCDCRECIKRREAA